MLYITYLWYKKSRTQSRSRKWKLKVIRSSKLTWLIT